MSFPRASGILLHPTSLPSEYGIGDLGATAYQFVDWLAGAGQSLWQVLPLGQTGYGDSPYQCFSAFAGNIYLICPDELLKEKLLTEEEVESGKNFPADRVDFGSVINWKRGVLNAAFERFRSDSSSALHTEYNEFVNEYDWWLNDYSLYRALKGRDSGKSWNQWDAALVRRDRYAMEASEHELQAQIDAEKFYQFLFFRQWFALKKYANDKGIKIIGDIPIFVAFDSADVWCNPSQFKLDDKGNPTVVAGVPPDYFSKTGQLWGNPIYNWERMQHDGFQWWIARIRSSLELYDILRVDHFRGFAAAWEVPGGDKTAERGQWVGVPGKELFTAILNALGDVPILAEDLGVITPDVEELRDSFGFPGMRILQFGFGGDPHNRDLPHNYIPNSVAYTGTHDNDTIVGWFGSAAGKGSTRDSTQISKEQNFCREYLATDGNEIHWTFIRALLASVADTALMPLQDVLGLGNETRMNLPASMGNNWQWRYPAEQLTEEIAERLKRLTEIYGRLQS